MKNKKTAILLSMLIFSTTLTITGCSKTTKVEGSSEAGNSTAEESSSETTAQPDPLAPDTNEESSSESAESSEKAEESDPAYSFDENGAVVLDSEKEHSDKTLIEAAQALFESACKTEWEYTVGCPYEVDYNDYIENEFEWQFYKITDSHITSFADIEADYYKVFSSEYPNKLSDLYKEKDGAVYALCGERGSDLYYVDSEITGITERSDNEITFSVENHYSGNDFTGEVPYSETDSFSVVVYDDGTWRAGEFTLPY